MWEMNIFIKTITIYCIPHKVYTKNIRQFYIILHGGSSIVTPKYFLLISLVRHLLKPG
jgi:hypothetical protein